MLESEIQRQIVDWIRYVAPECMVIAIPNAARRTASGRASNAVPGLTSGAPDLLVIRPRGEVLWMEVKTDKGKLTDLQFKFHENLQIRNHACAVVRSLDDARNAFKAVGIETRER